MTSKELKPNLNALNCVSLYKHEVCEAPGKKAPARRARVPRQTRSPGKPNGLLGLREKVAGPKTKVKKENFVKKFQRSRDVSLVDLGVAFGFLILFSAAATLAMVLAMD